METGGGSVGIMGNAQANRGISPCMQQVGVDSGKSPSKGGEWCWDLLRMVAFGTDLQTAKCWRVRRGIE